MSFGLLKGNISPIAVDFGVSSLKVLQISGDDPPQLICAAQLVTPDELLNDDNARLSYQIQGLSKLLRAGSFRGKRAICSIPASRTFAHMFLTPTSGVAPSEAVRQQLVTTAQLDPRQLILREIEVGEVMRRGTKHKAMLCIAMPRDVVLQHVEGLRRSKLETVGVHSEHLALVRSFDPITQRESDRDMHSLYIDLGYGRTKVILARGTEPTVAKTVPIAGRDIDAVAARSLKTSIAQTRAARHRGGEADPAFPAHWPELYAGFAAAAQLEIEAEAQHALEEPETAIATMEERRIGALPEHHAAVAVATTPPEPVQKSVQRPPACEALRILTEEISLTIAYHQQLFPGQKLARCVLVGGESRQASLCQHLAASLQLPLAVSNPMGLVDHRGARCVEVSFEEAQPGWAVPLGLCGSATDL
jgi:Tfp pilus assembly PilM family ATPase